jgi:hypothetical protein
MEYPKPSRIATIQKHHPWMLEREVSGLLVAMYAAICATSSPDDDIQELMDEGVERICADSRKGVEHALSNLPPKLLAACD